MPDFSAGTTQQIASPDARCAMADPNRIVNYNGYEIRIFVLPPTRMERTFRAKYEVRRVGDAAQNSPRAGVIAGGLETPDQAEEAALKAAKYMID